MRALKQLLLLLLLSLLPASHALGDVVVVVDARSGIDGLSRNEVINIFLGRHRRLPTGVAAVPVDQPLMGALRAEFYRKLVDKDLAEISAYWARLYFSGKTAPPIQAVSAAEVLTHILGRPGAIGYMDRSQVDARLRIVLEFAP